MKSSGLERVGRRWPKILEELKGSGQPPSNLEWLEDTPSPTLRVHGRLITSCLDREAEARVQADCIPQEASNARVYGLALGDLPRVLLQRSELQELTVILLNGSLDRLLLERFPYSWLDDPRVRLLTGTGLSEVSAPFAVAPGTLRCVAPGCGAIMEALTTTLTEPFQAKATDARSKEQRDNLRSNEEAIKGKPGVRKLFGQRTSAQALVIAAGPSLSRSIDGIRQHQPSSQLIAVTTALRPLINANIRPNFAIAVDASPLVLQHLEGFETSELRDMPLICGAAVHPRVVKAWPGPIYFAYLQLPIYQDLQARLPRGTLYCSGTVTHAAVDLARRMGYRRILLAGADFSFPFGMTHDKAVTQTKPRLANQGVLQIPNGYGAPVETSVALLGFLRDLEHYITAYPNLSFATLSRHGAAIAGAPYIAERAGK